MKVFVITLALASLASTATLDAQVYGRRPMPSTNTSINVDGSWRVVGRDGAGNTIYERRTTDRNGNVIIQRARRDARGNMSIISTNTVGNTGNNRNGTYNNNCNYNQTTNTIGDIIFGRNSSNVNCNDNGNRVDGGWYQVGNGRDNNSIYERRVQDSNGNLVIQRARRNNNGTFTILSSRTATNNDTQWSKAQRKQQKQYQKQQRQQDRQLNKDQDEQDNEWKGNNDKGNNDKGNSGRGNSGRGNNGKHKGNQDRD